MRRAGLVGAAGEQLGAALGAEQVHGGQPQAGVGADGGQQAEPGLGEALGGGPLEQVAAVLEVEVQAVGVRAGRRPLADLEGQVPLGRGARDRLDGEGEPGRRGRGGLGLQAEHDLEERLTGHRALRVEHLDQPLEGQVLVLLGGEAHLLGPGDEVAEGRVAGGVGAQHHGVDEHADHAGQGLVGAPGDGAADGDVGAGAEPGQQGGESGVQHHEGARAQVPGEGGQGAVGAGGHGHPHGAALVGGAGGPRVVEGQLELVRQARQGPCPVRELAGGLAVLVALVAEQLPLPQRVVGVLDGQRRPRGGRAGGARRVGLGAVSYTHL